jgi:hypothetical protein
VAACLIGVLYAAISAYWGAGGAWLLDTVGGTLARRAHDESGGLLLAVWAAVALKLLAAALAPASARVSIGSPWRPRVRIAAWSAAAVLTTYGLVLTMVGLLVRAGVIAAGRNADHRALAWHAYLWDPWFLLWGCLMTAALYRTR